MSSAIPTTWRFDVLNAVTKVQTFSAVPLYDREGNPILSRVPKVDETGAWVLGEDGYPIIVDGPQEIGNILNFDGYGQPITRAICKDLTFFVQKADISESEALSAFEQYTGSAYPNAIQSAYAPSQEEWAEVWATGLGPIIQP